jgi:hypothetical protein
VKQSTMSIECRNTTIAVNRSDSENINQNESVESGVERDAFFGWKILFIAALNPSLAVGLR